MTLILPSVATTIEDSGFTPASLSPDLWISASDLTTLWQDVGGTTQVTTAGQTIGKWDDKSGNGNHFVAAADDATRPLYQTTDYAHADFDGAADSMAVLGDVGLYAHGAFSIGIALRGDLQTGTYVVSETNHTTNTPLIGIIPSHGTIASAATVFYRRDGGTIMVNGEVQVSAASIYDETGRAIVYTDASASPLTIYRDNVTAATFTYTRGLPCSITRLSLGSLVRTTVSNHWGGRIAEVVAVKRVLTAQERADLTTYLGNKVGVSV